MLTLSSITTVRISHEQGFINLECLEEALKIHNLFLSFQIIKVKDKYQLNAITSTRDGNKRKIEESLKNQLNSAVIQILPTYIRLLAIKDFESRNFIFKNESNTSVGKLLVFEKSSSLREGGEFQRILITIREDNTLTIDAVNFVGRTCLETTRPFESKIGKVLKREMKLEANIFTRKKTETQNKQKLRI